LGKNELGSIGVMIRLEKGWEIFDHVINFLAFLAGILVILLMLITCFQVVMRYIFHAPFGWVVEICEYMLLYITFLGTAWLLRENGHVGVDIVLNFLHPQLRKILILVTSGICALACPFLVLYGMMITWDYFERGTLVMQTINTPKWILMAVIPMGGFMLTIQFLRQFLNLLCPKNARNGGTSELDGET
jgi:C4-dicarboxylate transporter, DctQ subunit